MKTPICDFVREYADSKVVRLHMPGHKGKPLLGFESFDLTEIKGADSLFEADGIIAESEAEAGKLFGARTLYSTEGSSLCIRAMIRLVLQQGKNDGRRPLIFAGRNAHKTFLSAVALLDCSVEWLTGEDNDSYLSCRISPDYLEKRLREARELPVAVYVTSPDYLGNTADICGIAAVCRRFGVMLAVDNAHGAYLKFLPDSAHPIDLGADICCDSAHKTLPALTGCAYLHISNDAPIGLRENAKEAMALFGSTSPSYLLLQSLDGLNAYIADGYKQSLKDFVGLIKELKHRLRSIGYNLVGDESLKLTVAPKTYGYCGDELCEFLREKGFECEFADGDFVVMMLTPSLPEGTLDRLYDALASLPRRKPVETEPPRFTLPKAVMTPREAMLSPSEIIPVKNAVGRVLADAGVGCPPAVPIIVSGEEITEDVIKAFEYYGVTECRAVKLG